MEEDRVRAGCRVGGVSRAILRGRAGTSRCSIIQMHWDEIIGPPLLGAYIRHQGPCCNKHTGNLSFCPSAGHLYTQVSAVNYNVFERDHQLPWEDTARGPWLSHKVLLWAFSNRQIPLAGHEGAHIPAGEFSGQR